MSGLGTRDAPEPTKRGALEEFLNKKATITVSGNKVQFDCGIVRHVRLVEAAFVLGYPIELTLVVLWITTPDMSYWLPLVGLFSLLATHVYVWRSKHSGGHIVVSLSRLETRQGVTTEFRYKGRLLLAERAPPLRVRMESVKVPPAPYSLTPSRGHALVFVPPGDEAAPKPLPKEYQGRSLYFSYDEQECEEVADALEALLGIRIQREDRDGR